MPAVPFSSLIPTNSHKLSVFEVNDDEGRIEQVATAVCLGKQKTDAVEYLIFDEADLIEIGVEFDKKSAGTTCDAEVNSWHWDLINFSANKMITLVKRTLPVVVSKFVPKKTVEYTFEKYHLEKNYDWSKIGLKDKDEIRKKLKGKGA